MTIIHKQLRELIVEPTLKVMSPLIPYSEAAVELLMMTAAHESKLGTYIKQVGGPALGIYQMEPITEQDIQDNYLKYRSELDDMVLQFMCGDIPLSPLVGNMYYATAMARVHYCRDSEALPDVTDLIGLSRYAKRVWNTDKGKASSLDYKGAYMKLCR